MNISQHSFVPRGRVIDGYYLLTSTPQLISNPLLQTTELQRGDIFNCVHFFGCYEPVSDEWFAIRMYYPFESSSSYFGVCLSHNGYASPQLRIGLTTFSSMAFNFSVSDYKTGCPVLVVLWYQN